MVATRVRAAGGLQRSGRHGGHQRPQPLTRYRRGSVATGNKRRGATRVGVVKIEDENCVWHRESSLRRERVFCRDLELDSTSTGRCVRF